MDGRAGSGRRTRRQVAEINVVPYIDVMLVLLVIFMITAPLLQTSVEIDLPDAAVDASAGQSNSEQQEPVVLSVNKEGDWYLSVSEKPENTIDRNEALKLVSAILRLDPDRRVVVAGDNNADYGQIMEGMIMLKQGGAKAIDLITEPAKQQ